MNARSLPGILVAAVAAVGLSAVGTSTAVAGEPAAAAPSSGITGTFHYSDLLAGTGSISNPTAGTCYTLPSIGLSATNNTNATAHLYIGTNCSIAGNDLPPGNTFNSGPFISVKFDSP
ncbi:hypothetical protein [Streptomyces sp. NPDC005876]|uniref:hypothetical protein n=1 Tax=unclassified Streptomyces TaxID=2593676 RepID=UPI00340BB8A3